MAKLDFVTYKLDLLWPQYNINYIGYLVKKLVIDLINLTQYVKRSFMLYDHPRSNFGFGFMMFIAIKVTAIYVVNLNCTCICSKELRPTKVLNLPEFRLILEGARWMYMYITEFMVVLRNTVLDFVFRIILKSDCNSSKSPTELVLMALRSETRMKVYMHFLFAWISSWMIQIKD